MRILVAYDASPGSDDALRDLARAGLPDDAEIRVLSVAADRGPEVGEASSAAHFGARASRGRAKLAMDAARTVAARGEARIREAFPGWRTSHAAAAGDASAALVEAAAEWPADLVVLGSHASRPVVGGAPLGSVARRVVASAPCSVRIGRDRRTGDGSRAARVIVGYDGSGGADAAVAAAAARRWPARSRARVLVVVDPIEQGDGGADDSRIPWARLRAQAGVAAGLLRSAGCEVAADVVTGDPRVLLAAEAGAWDADALFVGARGEHGPGKSLAGSVATAAVAHAPCTVEVVRSRTA